MKRLGRTLAFASQTAESTVHAILLLMNAKALNAGGIFGLLKETYAEWSKDNALRLGAALAYYSIFSAAPLILIAIGVAGWVYGQEAAQGKIVEQLQQVVGSQVAQAVQSLVQSAGQNSKGATLVGLVTLLVGASGVFAQLKDSLNTIWEVKPKANRGVMGFIKDRLLTFGMVLVIGFLLLVSLVITTALAAFNDYLEQMLGMPKFVSATLGFAIPLAVEVLLFAMIFKLLPDAEISWTDVWIGAGVTAVLFEIGKTLLGLYLGNASTTSSFGAAGSLVLLLLWVYYASLILFFGAEFTEVYARSRGKVIQPSKNAEPALPEDRAHEGLDPEIVPGDGAAARMGIRRVASAQPNPLTPEQATPKMPHKESLVPLMDPIFDIDPEPVPQPAPAQGGGVQNWIQTAHQHPFVEVGAALGVGLLVGIISRSMEREEKLTPGEHLKLGAKAAALAGISAMATMGPRLAGMIDPKVAKALAKTAGSHLSHLGEEIPAKVKGAFR